jgi:signal peptidase I
MRDINSIEFNRKSILKLTVIAFLAAIVWNLITICFFTTYGISGSSMEPTLHNGEKVLVNKLVYYVRGPHRKDVVILHVSKNTDFVKRVIAIDGDKIQFRSDVLYINGRSVDEPYLRENREKLKLLGFPLTKDFGPITIPKGKVFVMGDNRNNSVDSREIGMINIKDIVGRTELIYSPHSKLRLVK